jgi:hypothetical protein
MAWGGEGRSTFEKSRLKDGRVTMANSVVAVIPSAAATMMFLICIFKVWIMWLCVENVVKSK